MDKNISETILVNFDNLKETRLKIKQSFNEIDIIKKAIKQNYIQYIEQENTNFFGLDSFHFQNKAIELEYENMLRLYHFIDNRIYGDYYKLFLMISESLREQLSEPQLYKLKELQHLENYPMYKDLEPFKIYEFDLINQIHQDIILILSTVTEMVLENDISIREHQKHLKLGMNIDNYVINQQYKNHHLKLSNDLHENYLQVFHTYHDTWLKKYYEKLDLFYKQISHHREETIEQNWDYNEDENKVINSPKNEVKTTNDNISTLDIFQPDEKNAQNPSNHKTVNKDDERIPDIQIILKDNIVEEDISANKEEDISTNKEEDISTNKEEDISANKEEDISTNKEEDISTKKSTVMFKKKKKNKK